MKKRMRAGSGPFGNRDGSAIMIVICVSGILLITAVAISFMAGNAAFTSRKLHSGEQALAIAEAGAADMLSKLRQDFGAWANTSITTNFAQGAYVVTSQMSTNTGNVLITSTGTVGSDERTTALEVLGDLWLLYDSVVGAGDAILAENDCTLDTAALAVHGRVHANSDVLHTHGNTVIDGDVSSCGVVEVEVSPGHNKLPGSGRVVVPDYQPFDAWKAWAQSGGIYYPASVTLPAATLTPGNGVVYVDGDVEVRNQSGLVGTLVAAGTITIENRFDQTPFNTNWPALLAGIDVNLHNRNVYNGVIFAGNNVSSRNFRTINGCIIALNNVEADNRMVINPLTYSPAWDPTDTNPAPELIVGGWLR